MNSLFDPITIGNLTLKNHFIRSATSEKKADEQGYLTPDLLNIYEELAKNDIGLIITGYTFICDHDKATHQMMGMSDDSYIDSYKKMVERVHTHQTPLILQLCYSGSNHQTDPQAQVWGASAIEHPTTHITPCEMTKENIDELKHYFVQAACRAYKCGFDGVQIHAAHGYLLSQFLSPYFNHRQDEYGGSIENRMRLLCEILQEIKKQLPSYPLLIKINSSDEVENGFSEEECLQVCQAIQPWVDIIEISGGKPQHPIYTSKDESYYQSFAKQLAKLIDIPIILTGGNRSLSVMEEIASTSSVQFFGFCRPLLKDVAYVSHLKTAR